MEYLILLITFSASVFAAWRAGRNQGEATVTVDNFEQVVKNVKESKNIARSITPGTAHFERLREQYARK